MSGASDPPRNKLPDLLQLALYQYGKAYRLPRIGRNIGSQLFNMRGRRRRSLADCMIAAKALNGGASLATNNVADFERFVALGLVIEGA